MDTVNKTIKKIIALLFCLILVVSQTAVAEDANVIYSTINIRLRHNHMLSQYGVTVYIDDVEAAHLNQGDMITFGAYMKDNQTHELRFVADKYGVPDRVWTVGNLQQGSVLTCELQSKHNQVRVRQYDLSVNGDTVCSISPEIEDQVKLLGTIVVAGISIGNAAE